MAVESTLEYQISGVSRPVPIPGAVSRIVGFSGSIQQQVKGAPPSPPVQIHFREYESKEASEKVWEEVRIPFEGDPETYAGPGQIESLPIIQFVGEDYDPKNPEHKRQYDEQKAAFDSSSAPDKVPFEVQIASWKPSVQKIVGYTHTLVTEVWNGKCVGEPLRERTFELPLLLALQVVQMQVPGSNPQEAFDTLTSQLYRAAVQAGAFGEDAKYVP